jgi:hypothetical protein
VVSTQEPLQFVKPLAQHMPSEQVLPEQQSPSPLQLRPVSSQGGVQVPLTQVHPELHELSHAPQLAGSES